MQVSVETTSGLERRLTVGIPAADIDGAVDLKIKDTASKVRINGFRPGKVPLREVKRRYGSSIREEVLGEMVNKHFYDAITQEGLAPAGMPQIDRVKDKTGEDFEFVAVFEVYPELPEVQGFEKIAVTRPVSEVNDADVEVMIQKLREQRAKYEDVERAAQDGDQLTIDFDGLVDGETFEGGSAADTPLVLGSNSMIPGFEDGLVGALKADVRSLDLAFPDDYHAEELKGKQVVFNVTVKAVAEQTLPEIDDVFIAQFNPKENTVESFREEVKGNMVRELKQTVKNKIKQQVLDGLLEHNELDAPKAMIDAEIERQRKQMIQQFGGGGDFDSSMLPAELFEGQATRTVKLTLILGELIKQKQIKADADKVRSTIEEMAEPYEDPAQVINWYYENEQQLQQIESLVLEDQAIETVLAEAALTDEQMSYDEAVKPAEQAEETA